MVVRPSRLSDDRPACQDEACAIQTCLSRHSFQPQHCNPQLLSLYRCCLSFYDKVNAGEYKNLSGVERGEVKSSTACPMEGVVRRKVVGLEEEVEGKKK